VTGERIFYGVITLGLIGYLLILSMEFGSLRAESQQLEQDYQELLTHVDGLQVDLIQARVELKKIFGQYKAVIEAVQINYFGDSEAIPMIDQPEEDKHD